MLKHCKQSSRLSHDSRNAFEGRIHNGQSFDNMAYNDTDALSSAGAKDLDSRSVRIKSSLSFVTNSTLEKDSSPKKVVTLESIHEEPHEVETSLKDNFCKRCIVIAVILIVAVLVVCLAVGYFYIGYYPEEKYLNYGDERIIDYSSYFCSAVTSEHHDIWLSVVSNVYQKKQVKYTMDALLYLEVDQIWSRMFHLNKNSIININVTSKDIVHVFVFKGKRNYDLWVERKTTISYAMKQACCVNGEVSNPDQFEFRSYENSDYYLVFLQR